MPGDVRASARRVVVSGVGAVSGFGWGVAPLWEGLRAGRTGLGPFARFDHAAHRTHLAAEAPAAPAELAALVSGIPGWRRLSQADRFALFAAAEALAAAGLASPLGETAGVFFGSSTGGMYEAELCY